MRQPPDISSINVVNGQFCNSKRPTAVCITCSPLLFAHDAFHLCVLNMYVRSSHCACRRIRHDACQCMGLLPRIYIYIYCLRGDLTLALLSSVLLIQNYATYIVMDYTSVGVFFPIWRVHKLRFQSNNFTPSS